MKTIQTVTGPIDVANLGKTLVHEHLLIGYPGWFMDALAPKFVRAEALAKAVDSLSELYDRGVRTFVDPCPMDLGRDVEFMAEAAAASKMQIICTTGAYKENEGLTYTFRALPVEDIEEIYVKELTEGIGSTGIKPGLVKAATGAPEITEYERKLLTAAGRAAARVGCNVLTHTDDARCGLEQIEILTGEGVPPHRLLIGHCDGRSDHGYHRALADRGSYVGFDRFGIEVLNSDENRIESVLLMRDAGYTRSVCLSQDCTCAAWLGRPVFDGHMVATPEQIAAALPNSTPTHLLDRIVPRLLEKGLTQEDIDTMLVENPRRYFDGESGPRAAVS